MTTNSACQSACGAIPDGCGAGAAEEARQHPIRPQACSIFCHVRSCVCIWCVRAALGICICSTASHGATVGFRCGHTSLKRAPFLQSPAHHAVQQFPLTMLGTARASAACSLPRLFGELTVGAVHLQHHANCTLWWRSTQCTLQLPKQPLQFKLEATKRLLHVLVRVCLASAVIHTGRDTRCCRFRPTLKRTGSCLGLSPLRSRLL